MTSRLSKILAAAMAIAVLCVPAQAGLAQSPVLNDDVLDVAKQLNCPTCAGRNLADCPTDTCLQWKTEIAAQLQQGKTAAEVMAYFQQRFGTTVLQEPPQAGQTLLLWVVPVVGFVALAIAALVVIRRASQPQRAAPLGAAAAPEAATAPEDPFVTELERQV